jgi:soluble epoxide hydrolase/lipid-phosphate phosphatase
MDSFTARDVVLDNGEKTHYYETGSADGTPLIFIHGWPDLAEEWKHQMAHFGKMNYRVIAPDMRGYGGSSSPKNKEAYSLEVLVPELVEFAGKLGIEKAVWIGHDWGCGVLNALAAHYPEICIGLALLSVPYRTIELGLDFMKTTINRDIYPEDEYEWGQWDYQRFYELYPEKSVEEFEKGPTERITKAMYLKHDPSKWGKPSALSRIQKDGGWFGGKADALPDIPLEYTCLDESLLASLIKSHQQHGWFPAASYYFNHAANTEYSKSEKNGGVLEFPVLFVDAKHDSVCSPSTTPKLAENQRKFTKNLTYVTIESAHWVQLEKPKEVNETLEKWLKNL